MNIKDRTKPKRIPHREDKTTFYKLHKYVGKQATLSTGAALVPLSRKFPNVGNMKGAGTTSCHEGGGGGEALTLFT